jgi:hypothetical protein
MVPPLTKLLLHLFTMQCVGEFVHLLTRDFLQAVILFSCSIIYSDCVHYFKGTHHVAVCIIHCLYSAWQCGFDSFLLILIATP